MSKILETFKEREKDIYERFRRVDTPGAEGPTHKDPIPGLIELETKSDVQEHVQQSLLTERGSLLLWKTGGIDTRSIFDRAADRARRGVRGAVRGFFRRNLDLRSLDDFLTDIQTFVSPASTFTEEQSLRPELDFIGRDARGAKSYVEYLNEKFKPNLTFLRGDRYKTAVGKKTSTLGRSSSDLDGLLGWMNTLGGDQRVSHADFINHLDGNYAIEFDPRDDIRKQLADKSPRRRYFKDISQQAAISRSAENESTIGKLIEDRDTINFLFWSKLNNENVYVRFRALLDKFVESVTPTYHERTYVNRIEKFYTYDSIKRDTTLSFYLHAWSELELDHIWQKVGYLTNLAYPLGYRGGYPSPNICFLTMGKVYTKQPLIVTSVSYDYLDGESWDIHAGRPMTVKVDMKFDLLDKDLYSANGALTSNPYGMTNG